MTDYNMTRKVSGEIVSLFLDELAKADQEDKLL